MQNLVVSFNVRNVFPSRQNGRFANMTDAELQEETRRWAAAAASEVLADGLHVIDSALKSGRSVLVHCKHGAHTCTDPSRLSASLPSALTALLPLSRVSHSTRRLRIERMSLARRWQGGWRSRSRRCAER